MYPNEPSEASLKGDYWHDVMEDTIKFGVVPKVGDFDLEEAMQQLLDYVNKRRAEMGKGTRTYVEVTMTIPETGEPGTGDITLVGPKETEVIDLKSGYVPVNVYMNPQIGLYLCGAIALYGQRPKYTGTIFQPMYDHIDGPIRSYSWSHEDIDWLRQEVKYAIANDSTYGAGKHCKDTYCPHRGDCAAFAAYVGTELAKGWFPHEVNGVSDDDLAAALDQADEASGHRNALRQAALKRILNADREIPGYKVVKGRKQREIRDAKRLVINIAANMGVKYATMCFPELGWLGEETINANFEKPEVLKCIGSPKHIEDIIKQYARDLQLERGQWKQIYQNVCGAYILETNSGLTLERAIDGRPAHKRGNEFTPITNAPVQII
jgi:Protein of unknown function (DUF2800).